MNNDLIERLSEIAHPDSANDVTVRADDLREAIALIREHASPSAALPEMDMVPSKDLPEGYQIGHKGNDWWPLFDGCPIGNKAYPSKIHADLAAWQNSHEKLRSRLVAFANAEAK